ncbi:MAG: branched-chain amino acid ABC transporter permease [Deltaproteobacteria bacterium]|nr:branched-chain amino acid ABC transporter permease [Deltaproteobacteria bacterium]
MSVFFQQLLNGLSLGSIYALIALGYTMVYGVLKLINFAHSDVFMVGAFVGLYVAAAFGASGAGAAPLSVPAAVAVLCAAMAACALLGMSIERFAYRPVRTAPKLTPLITAIGMSLLLENLGQLVFGAEPERFPQILREVPYHLGGVVVTNIKIAIFATTLVLMWGLHRFVTRTWTGKAMRALSLNLDAARLMGIQTDRVIAITFGVGSALAAAGGILFGLDQTTVTPLMGILNGLKAFVAAVLGGIGNIPGAVVGGLAIGVSEQLVAGYVSTDYRDAITFGILIVMLLVRPQGLLGAIRSEKV